jgi:myo-inositol-1(or 4)-monophosphatase
MTSPFLDTAIDAVVKAGDIQLAYLERGLHLTDKGPSDIVTDADIAVETMFRAMIADRFPSHGVLGEELAEALSSGGGAVHRWLFDPIDGTANYASGLPFFCASLALEVSGVIDVAAVYEPTRRELFTAERGRGASLNGRALRVSSVDRFGDAMLGCGFPHGARTRVPAMEALFGECAIRGRGVRRLGSAALELCYVAAARLDGFWDQHLKPWDTAAGALIVQEAGGVVTDFEGGPFSCYRGGVLASNGQLHQALVAVIAATAASV